MTRKRDSSGRTEDMIRLVDLVPRADVTGGRGKLRFGERITQTDNPGRDALPERSDAPAKGRAPKEIGGRPAGRSAAKAAGQPGDISAKRVATKEGGAVKGGQEVPPSPYRPAKRLT
jgi:hypothetical protein